MSNPSQTSRTIDETPVPWLEDHPIDETGRFVLPDPLPERLPHETPGKYRRRVLPGHYKRACLVRRRNRTADEWVTRATADDPTLDEGDISAIRAEALDEWDSRNPDTGCQLAWLNRRIPRLWFSQDGTPNRYIPVRSEDV